MIKLMEFQQTAASMISDRFAEYWENPAITGRRQSARALPFYQSLASITASGKTVVLAAAVADIAAGLSVKPVILWISRGKVVVEQSYANLATNGKYHDLLDGADVRPLAEFDEDGLREARGSTVFFATVGTFNQKDKEEGGRLIFRSDIDTTASSTWDALKARHDKAGTRRPLIVVYDEAHNLSDQQVDLILELEPQALLMASATMRLPSRLAAELQELKAKTGHEDSWLVTSVDAVSVADAGLVKSTVLLAGYKSPMEETLDALLSDMCDAEADAATFSLEGLPRAIYVSQTNIVEGNAYQTDDARQPFAQRQAPPILIWRYLVEHHHIDPNLIAVYCTLKFDRNYPAPDDFHLFKGGDSDYQNFIEGSYRHVIFNLSLQEGWDDPLAYFAYIDKSMDSRVQVEQVIGRLLRQPGLKHYASERLNTAHFYVRVDRNAVFDALIADVGRKLRSEAPAVKVIARAPGKQRPTELQPRAHFTIPGTGYDTSEAIEPIARLIANFPDFSDDKKNTRGEGARRLVSRAVGADDDLDPTAEAEWETYRRANVVSARWLFTREVRRLFQNALGVASTADSKFDAMIGMGSSAHMQLQILARQVVDSYLDNVFLKQRRPDPYVVGPQLVRIEEMMRYENSLHEGYDSLNTLEAAFAVELDRTSLSWCRNPSRTGYRIPLVSLGATNTFYPDFLLWSEGGGTVHAIDTTGGHLLPEKAARKLLAIKAPRDAEKIISIAFVSEGRWTADIEKVDSDGFTVWELSPNQERRAMHVDDMRGCIQRILRSE